FELKDYNIAIENLNKVIELNPNNEKAYFNRAFLNSILEIYKKCTFCNFLRREKVEQKT
ncbi:tetratricopeptide repeat protein, partial [Brachyspira hyodysenteriae]|uniref:tetratricopeptide repeat protein n=1 Tax=Brachyspira hyodysenteriae TaxID=159 RepID=UPI001177B6BD